MLNSELFSKSNSILHANGNGLDIVVKGDISIFGRPKNASTLLNRLECSKKLISGREDVKQSDKTMSSADDHGYYLTRLRT